MLGDKRVFRIRRVDWGFHPPSATPIRHLARLLEQKWSFSVFTFRVPVCLGAYAVLPLNSSFNSCPTVSLASLQAVGLKPVLTKMPGMDFL